MSSNSNTSSKTMSDTSSIYSTASDATTLKGDTPIKNSKWYSLSSKTPKTSKTLSFDSNKNTDKDIKKKLVHSEAVATYLALR